MYSEYSTEYWPTGQKVKRLFWEGGRNYRYVWCTCECTFINMYVHVYVQINKCTVQVLRGICTGTHSNCVTISYFTLLCSFFFRLEELSEAQCCCYNLSLSTQSKLINVNRTIEWTIRTTSQFRHTCTELTSLELTDTLTYIPAIPPFQIALFPHSIPIPWTLCHFHLNRVTFIHSLFVSVSLSLKPSYTSRPICDAFLLLNNNL